MKKVALMLAGGKGTRLYPLSTEEKPKQFLNLLSDQSMLQDSIDRIVDRFDQDSIYINTIDKYIKYIEGMPHDAIIEPKAKGTTLSLLLNVLLLYRRHGDCIITVLPSDHYIEDEEQYRYTLHKANVIAGHSDDVVLVGIEPTDYETGYGYIKHDVGNVSAFKEKPNYEQAKEYTRSGYLWNGGIFVFKASVMIDIYDDLYGWLVDKVRRALDDDKVRSLYEDDEMIIDSFEKTIIQKIYNLKVVTGKFGWEDIGDLERYKNLKGRIANG